MENPLSKLALDAWYKVFIAAGAFVFLINGTGLLSAYPTKPTALISAGFFFWGIGEWINHPYQESLMLDNFNRPYGKISGHRRKARGIGILLDVAGLGLILFGLIKFL